MTSALNALLKPLIPAAYRPRLKGLYYRGQRYHCPSCGSHLRKFLTYGLPFAVLKEKDIIGGGCHENVLCPVCNAVDRERLLLLYLQNKTDLFSRPQKILHIAPEPCIENRLLAMNNPGYLTADLYRPGVMVKMDITDIRYPDDTFDVIICNHVLEHVPDDRKAMRELFRVLRPGGWAILQVPISATLAATYEDWSVTTDQGRELAFGQSDHVRIYAHDYAGKLQDAGFGVKLYHWTEEAAHFGGQSNPHGLNTREAIYHATKR